MMWWTLLTVNNQLAQQSDFFWKSMVCRISYLINDNLIKDAGLNGIWNSLIFVIFPYIYGQYESKSLLVLDYENE